MRSTQAPASRGGHVFWHCGVGRMWALFICCVDPHLRKEQQIIIYLVISQLLLAKHFGNILEPTVSLFGTRWENNYYYMLKLTYCLGKAANYVWIGIRSGAAVNATLCVSEGISLSPTYDIIVAKVQWFDDVQALLLTC
jgi:hypothetical protein